MPSCSASRIRAIAATGSLRRLHVTRCAPTFDPGHGDPHIIYCFNIYCDDESDSAAGGAQAAAGSLLPGVEPLHCIRVRYSEARRQHARVAEALRWRGMRDELTFPPVNWPVPPSPAAPRRAPSLPAVLGSWGNTMRGAVRNKERC